MITALRQDDSYWSMGCRILLLESTPRVSVEVIEDLGHLMTESSRLEEISELNTANIFSVGVLVSLARLNFLAL